MKESIIASMTMAAVLGLTVPAMAQSQSQSQSSQSSQGQSSESSQDAKFIRHAAEGNLAEIQMGKVAAQKSQNSEVKQYAEHLQTDHQAANQKLQQIAQSKGVQFPQTLDSKHQKQADKLQRLSGAQFDQEFATTALRSHGKTIELYQREAQQGQDPALKQYAQSQLPTLQHHLQMAQTMAQSVGVSQSTISSILNKYPNALGGASTPSGQGQGAGSSESSGQSEKQIK